MNKSSIYLFASFITISALSISCSGTKYAATNRTTPLAESHTIPQQLNATPATTTALQNKYAQLLGVPPLSVQNIKLYQFIDSWYHAPYKYAGRTKSGVDCSDFVSLLLDSVYTVAFDGSSASMFTHTKPVKKEDLQEGDLVFFKISGDRISHVGFYLTNNKFVHASVSQGITISDLNEDYYKKYFYSGGRLTSN